MPQPILHPATIPAALILTLAHDCLAQDRALLEEHFTFDSWFQANANAGFAGGDTSINRWGFEAGGLWNVSDNIPLRFEFSAERSHYQITGWENSLAHDNMDAWQLRLVTYLGWKVDDDLLLLAVPILTSSFEDGADAGDGLSIGSALAVRWQVSPTFALSGGALLLEELSGGIWVIPMGGVDWKISDKWRVASRGPKMQLTYKFAPSWQVFLQGAYEPREFRLADRDNSILRDRTFSASMGVEWEPVEGVELTATGGLLVGQELVLLDAEGREKQKATPETTPYFKVGCRVRF